MFALRSETPLQSKNGELLSKNRSPLYVFLKVCDQLQSQKWGVSVKKRKTEKENSKTTARREPGGELLSKNRSPPHVLLKVCNPTPVKKMGSFCQKSEKQKEETGGQLKHSVHLVREPR